MGLVLFRLATPPHQPRVVGPYPVRGAWFPNRMPLEGTSSIQILGRNRGTRPRQDVSLLRLYETGEANT
jgi:hypothetical protein